MNIKNNKVRGLLIYLISVVVLYVVANIILSSNDGKVEFIFGASFVALTILGNIKARQKIKTETIKNKQELLKYADSKISKETPEHDA